MLLLIIINQSIKPEDQWFCKAHLRQTYAWVSLLTKHFAL